MVSLNRRSKGLDSIKKFNRYLVEVGEVGEGGGNWGRSKECLCDKENYASEMFTFRSR